MPMSVYHVLLIGIEEVSYNVRSSQMELVTAHLYIT